MMGIVNVNCSVHSGIIGFDHFTKNCLPPVFGRRVNDILDKVTGLTVTFFGVSVSRVYGGKARRRGRRVRARCENCGARATLLDTIAIVRFYWARTQFN